MTTMNRSGSLNRESISKVLASSGSLLSEISELVVGVYNVAGEAVWLPDVDAGRDALPAAINAHAGLEAELLYLGTDRVVRQVDDAAYPNALIAPIMVTHWRVGVLFAVPAKDSAEIDWPRARNMVELYALFLGRIAEGDALNGQLTNELINKYEELSLVFTLGDALNVSKKQDEALEIIFGAIRGALNADLTLLWFPGLDFERASTPDCDEWRDLNHALLARLRSTRDSFAMNDLSGDPKLAAYGDRLRNIAATLVEVDGDQGVLAISRDDEHAPMRMNDLRILEAIARETSIFLANKKLQDARTQLFDLTIFAMARLSESRDDDTGAHLHRVSSYCVLLTKVLFSRKKYCVEDPEAFIENIARSSILHDIGKVGIPDAILLKPGKLTDEEFEVMKTHAMIGGDTIRDIEEQLNWGENNFLTLGRQIAYSHHEKWNGTGYPNGLEGTTIPLAARIMAVADVYDALTTKRCYKEAFSHGKAVEILTADSGSHFDPATIEAFLACEAEFDAVRRSHQGLDIEEPLSIPSLSQLGTEWLSKA